MFRSNGPDRNDPALMMASIRSYESLRRACAPFSGSVQPLVFELVMWTMAHGIAMLGGALPHDDCAPRTNPMPFRLMLDRMLYGDPMVRRPGTDPKD